MEGYSTRRKTELAIVFIFCAQKSPSYPIASIAFNNTELPRKRKTAGTSVMEISFVPPSGSRPIAEQLI